MHRFRKKSETKRGEAQSQASSPGRFSDTSVYPGPTASTYSTNSQASSYLQPLPSLPPASDFRTSLILPDLTKRFTLLRTSTGDPVSLDDLKSRFAQQRAAGTGHIISEEEEDMLLEALSRIRGSNAGISARASSGGSDNGSYVKGESPSSPSPSASDFAHSSIRQSAQSTTTTSSGLQESVMGGSSLSPSPSNRSMKRHSNNMFGGGSFKDRTYIRKQTTRAGGSNRSVLSATPSDSTTGSASMAFIDSYADTPRPVTPENATPSIISTSSPSDKSSTVTHSPIHSIASTEDGSSGESTLRFSKRLTSSQLKRMSTSLEKAIQEMEEEAEDQVLVPRTPLTANSLFSKAPAVTMDVDTVDENNVAHAITTVNDSAVTFSEADVDRPSSAGGFRSPSPYYAAGLKSPVSRAMAASPPIVPRAVTPRNVDLEDQRSYSTTPRATSQSSSLSAHERLVHTVPLSLSASTLLRHGSNASTAREERRPTSPLSTFTFPKSPNGMSTPESRNGAFADGSPQTQSPTPWKRPVSPLSSSAFQSLNGGSRPGTPSNVTWNLGGTNLNGQSVTRNGSFTSHSRNASTTSIGNSQDMAELKSDAKATLRSATRSPPFPGFGDYVDDDAELKPKLWTNGTNGFPMSSASTPNLGFDASALTYRATRSPSPGREAVDHFGSQTNDNEAAGGAIQRMRSPFLTPPSSPFSQKYKSNPLMVPPLTNSSRSSLAPAGSSYHSWDEEHNFGITYINTSDSKDPVWHDIPMPSEATTNPPPHKSGSRSKPSLDDPEYILRHSTGLSKMDLMTIQSKLLDAAATRAKTNETRSPSTLRRRRPSTAQSIQSFGGPSRTTSPAPQRSMGASSFARTTDNVAKASALLNSLADSIEMPASLRSPDFAAGQGSEREVVVDDLGPSSPSRRNRDLTDILFGSEGADSAPVGSPSQPALHDTALQNQESKKVEEELAPVSRSQPANSRVEDERHPQRPDFETNGSPVANHEPSDLLLEVQRRTEAAMAQLQRPTQSTRSPSQTGTPRKRINRQDISSPTLVQSSTSIDKIPTFPTSPFNSPGPGPQRSGSKITNGIRRLRNTLRSKPSTPSGDEVSPWTSGVLSTSPNSPQIHQVYASSPRPALLNPASNGSFNGFKSTSSISPPASAGPSLKTFMSRFRKKGSNENQIETEHRNGSSSLSSSLTSSSFSPDERPGIPVPFSAPATQVDTFPKTTNTPYTPQSLVLSRQQTDTATIQASQVPAPLPSSPSDPAALKRFFDAAQDIGLGQVALDYLSSVNPEWAPSTPTVIVTANESAKNSLDDTHAREESLSPTDRVASPVSDFEQPADLGRSRSLRERQVSPPVPRRVREIAESHGNINNPIVRRTLIFPSANGSSTDLASLVRKASKKAHRASAVSTQSNRSIHDRVPTPPPSKAKRQSVESEPPVPILPSSLSWANHAAPRNFSDATTEKSNSLHESFYDMYTGDRTGSSQAHDQFEPPKTPVDESIGDTEAGQAIEITELANGETIWSIVDGLRADDSESIYHHRVSMASAFSEAPHESEGEQLFFKEHARNLSKGSSRSNLVLQRKGTLTGASRNRPETKVFYSSSNHIARLIEQLSRSADAGSFNIKPTKRPGDGGHSHSGSLQSESDAHWTVEERLDHMLGVVGTAS